jgi:hypothetical protein
MVRRVGALGACVPILREMHEMLYRRHRDYYSDSSIFCNEFTHTPKNNEAAAKETVRELGNNAGH